MLPRLHLSVRWSLVVHGAPIVSGPDVPLACCAMSSARMRAAETLPKKLDWPTPPSFCRTAILHCGKTRVCALVYSFEDCLRRKLLAGRTMVGREANWFAFFKTEERSIAYTLKRVLPAEARAKMAAAAKRAVEKLSANVLARSRRARCVARPDGVFRCAYRSCLSVCVGGCVKRCAKSVTAAATVSLD
jgi:hypothetical protein